MLTGSPDFVVGCDLGGTSLLGSPQCQCVYIFLLGSIPQRSLFLSSAWEVKVQLPGFWELSEWRGPGHGGQFPATVLSHLFTQFSVLASVSQPCLGYPRSRDPLHSPKRKFFRVPPCWEKDSHPVMGSGRRDLRCHCFSDTLLPTRLCPTPSFRFQRYLVLPVPKTWFFHVDSVGFQGSLLLA